jgi:hypothetical protein
MPARASRRLRALSFASTVNCATRDGAPLLDVSSNDYLGLSQHPLLKARAAEWAQRHGAGAPASRLVTGTREITLAVEEKLAAFKGREAALLFSSGFQANATVLPALARKVGADDDGDFQRRAEPRQHRAWLRARRAATTFMCSATTTSIISTICCANMPKTRAQAGRHRIRVQHGRRPRRPAGAGARRRAPRRPAVCRRGPRHRRARPTGARAGGRLRRHGRGDGHAGQGLRRLRRLRRRLARADRLAGESSAAASSSPRRCHRRCWAPSMRRSTWCRAWMPSGHARRRQRPAPARRAGGTGDFDTLESSDADRAGGDRQPRPTRWPPRRGLEAAGILAVAIRPPTVAPGSSRLSDWRSTAGWAKDMKCRRGEFAAEAAKPVDRSQQLPFAVSLSNRPSRATSGFHGSGRTATFGLAETGFIFITLMLTGTCCCGPWPFSAIFTATRRAMVL